MKKGEIYEGLVERVEFPNKGVLFLEDKKVTVKNGIAGQRIRFRLTKNRSGKGEGRLIEVLEKSPIEDAIPECIHFGACGGCTYQTLSYQNQLTLKKGQVKALLDTLDTTFEFEEILGSPNHWAYRNKMEYSFGDMLKDGPLTLGLHKRGSFHDIITTNQCKIVDNDYNLILDCVLNYFKDRNVPYYKKMKHEGYLRHLVVRKAATTNEILVNLITSSQLELDLEPFVAELKQLVLKGRIVGIIHTINDTLADVVQSDEMRILYGQDYFYESILGLRFKISPFSFFQTNSLGAEVLYSVVRDYVGETRDKVIFDLYSGTGTIAQMLAPVAKKVVGVEIVEEAVVAAKENGKLNQLANCEFIAGDVLKVVDELEDKPDIIVLDPPRDGIHPKAIQKIIDFGVEQIVYVSCKPTSLVRDLAVFLENGYEIKKVRAVDMFAMTVHVETCVLLSHKNPQTSPPSL